MSYVKRWDEVPEVEPFPGNFRTGLAGTKVGLNRIRWVHPTGVDKHSHSDTEQVVIVLEGKLKWIIGDDELILTPGDVAIIPAGVSHSAASTGGPALFLEVFAPLRVQNLIGYVGYEF